MAGTPSRAASGLAAGAWSGWVWVTTTATGSASPMPWTIASRWVSMTGPGSITTASPDR